jgi:hypothetical protein
MKQEGVSSRIFNWAKAMGWVIGVAVGGYMLLKWRGLVPPTFL